MHWNELHWSVVASHSLRVQVCSAFWTHRKQTPASEDIGWETIFGWERKFLKKMQWWCSENSHTVSRGNTWKHYLFVCRTTKQLKHGQLYLSTPWWQYGLCPKSSQAMRLFLFPYHRLMQWELLYSIEISAWFAKFLFRLWDCLLYMN